MIECKSRFELSTFEQFTRDACQGNVAAVVKAFDEYSAEPLGVFNALASNARYSFLFESVEGNKPIAHYSFAGANPYMVVRGRGDQTLIETENCSQSISRRAIDYVADHFRQRKLCHLRDRFPLAGGAVGLLGYEAAEWFEPALQTKPREERESDDAVFLFFRTLFVIDHVQRQTKIVSVAFTDDDGNASLRQLYDRAIEQIEHHENLCQQSESSVAPRHRTVNHNLAIKSNFSKERFEAGVGFIKERIAAGDCYQVVLSQRLEREVTADPLSIYTALRQINPSPYMYIVNLDGNAVIGASPEMLVRCGGRRIDYRPIAGTRPRVHDDEEDARLSDELRNDEKEIAEHIMLVDLGRNDVGRVAVYGSVHVSELMTIEKYSHVQHLVSHVTGQLRDGCDRFDALSTCFPAGTVTGAPKVRAMQLIDELEPRRRGIYAGAVLYLDYADNLDSCIAIRTIELKDGVASVQAGAGIVADSVPALEYAETLHKAATLFRAIEMAEETQ